MAPEALPLPMLGLLLGMQHATDSDHVIAVTTLVAREHSVWRAVGLGAAWGIGHSSTVVACGALILALRPAIPPQVGLGLELLVAVILIALGVRNLRAIAGRASRHAERPHTHGPSDAHGRSHGHAHAHSTGLRSWPAATAVGVVHGLAGSTAIALVIMTTVREWAWGLAYLVLFSLGTIAGMVLLTTVISMPVLWTVRRSRDAHRWITVATGVLGVMFGCFLVWRVGVVDGLFTGNVHWDPH